MLWVLGFGILPYFGFWGVWVCGLAFGVFFGVFWLILGVFGVFGLFLGFPPVFGVFRLFSGVFLLCLASRFSGFDYFSWFWLLDFGC